MFYFNPFFAREEFSSVRLGGAEEVHHLCPIHILKISFKTD